MDYTIVTASHPEHLAVSVRMNISQGWEPLGGVSFCEYMHKSCDGSSEAVTYFVQAMTRNGAAGEYPIGTE